MSSGGSGTLLRAHYITPYRWCANTGELRRPAGTLISIFAATTTSTAPWRWPRRPLLPKERAKKLFWRRLGGTGCPHRPVSTFFDYYINCGRTVPGDPEVGHPKTQRISTGALCLRPAQHTDTHQSAHLPAAETSLPGLPTRKSDSRQLSRVLTHARTRRTAESPRVAQLSTEP